MKDLLKRALSLLFALILTLFVATPGAFSRRACAVSAVDIEKEINGILKDEVTVSGAGSVQALLDGRKASEWVALAIIQYAGNKYDYSSYCAKLREYVAADTYATSSTKEKHALLFAAMNTDSSYIKSIVNSEIGELGIMSYIFGLHLIANGYQSSKYTADEVIDILLSMQLDDGGWLLGSGSSSDVDVTAMAVQCLAHYKGREQVKTAINKAVTLLSSRQYDDGGFSSYGKKNPESAAQVIVALTALGINPLSDSRFIKDGNSAVDFMLSYKATDYGFTHTPGGGRNVTATEQALYSLVSIYRLQNGKGSLYKLNAGVTVTVPSISAPATTKKPSGSGGSVGAAATTKPAPATTRSPQTTAAPTSAKPQEQSTANQPGSTTKKPKPSNRSVFTTTVTETNTSSAKDGTTAKGGVQTTSGKNTDKTSQKAEETITVTESRTDINESTSQKTPSAATHTKSQGTPADKKETQSTDTKENKAEKQKNSPPVKLIIIAGVWAVAAAAALALLLVRKNKKISNYIVIAAVAGVLTLIAGVSDIKTTEEYYAPPETSTGETIAVTMSIDCKTVAGRGDESITPSDGVILEPTVFYLEPGSTAYDCLITAARQYRIQIEDSSQTLSDHTSAYISGINYLYHFDYGDLSGWMYSVNGDFADVGCGEYTLSDGDVIMWQYTTNLGDDLK